MINALNIFNMELVIGTGTGGAGGTYSYGLQMTNKSRTLVQIL